MTPKRIYTEKSKNGKWSKRTEDQNITAADRPSCNPQFWVKGQT